MLQYNLIHLPEVDSTNSYMNNLLAKTCPLQGTVVYTDFQTDGKGQIGRNWSSSLGKNVLMSIFLTPTFVPVQYQFSISKFIACTIISFLSKLGMDHIKVKWPNDIYCRDKKIAGILIQNQIMGHTLKSTIVGIGLNVFQTEWPPHIPNPTSIAMEQCLPKNWRISDFIKHFLDLLNHNYSKFVINASNFDDQYLSHLYRLGTWHSYCDKEGNFTGKIEGVSPHGLLIITKESGDVYEYGYREVSYLH